MSENETAIDFPAARELCEEQRAEKIQPIVREARRLASGLTLTFASPV